MCEHLSNRHILLGISGSIAAYKSASLLRLLVKADADVQVVMTSDAQRFITPLTLSTLSRKDVLTDIFPDSSTDTWTKHVSLGLWADAYVIAPASAQTIAKLAQGFCDNMLTAVALAARCPILVFPAMDHDMYVHPATQKNLATLSDYGYRVFDTDRGELASGLVGLGRLPEPEQITAHIRSFLAEEATRSIPKADFLRGKRVLVTAGPTREAIDPIRFVSNYSTGTMGFELAAEARRLGGDVALVTGPTHLPTPPGVERIDIVSAAEMAEAVFRRQDADVIIMAAAVGDYTPVKAAEQKIKKTDHALTLTLQRTVDILAELGRRKTDRQTLIGFALETENLMENARSKLSSKNLDWIVLNSPNEEGGGFGTTTNKVSLIGRDGSVESFPLLSKKEVAQSLLAHIGRAERR